MSIKKKILAAAKFVYDVLQGALILTAAVIVVLCLIGIRPYAVQTGSMEPEIPTGSICFVNHNTKYGSIAEGDIIAFKAGEMMVTHRAVRIEREGIVTKGDANNIEDAGLVTEENFVGETIFHIPMVGYLMMWLKTTFGLIALVSAAVLFTLIGMLIKHDVAANDTDDTE